MLEVSLYVLYDKEMRFNFVFDIYRQILVEIDSSMLSPQRMDMPFFKAPSIASTDDIMTPPAGFMLTGVSRDYIDSDCMIIIIFFYPKSLLFRGF